MDENLIITDNTHQFVRKRICEDFFALWKEISEQSSLVFHRNGEPLHYPAIQNAYNKAFRAAGLPFRSTHVLRHTFATLFLDETGHSEALRSVLGHKSFSMTERYAHAMEFSQVEAMKRFKLGMTQNVSE